MATQPQQVKPPADPPAKQDESASNYDPLLLHQVLEEEYISLHGRDSLPVGYDTVKAPAERLKVIYRKIHEAKHAALCISGGGIRSATFGLGILQGLARGGMLGKFHYLSTVSGGGYIGSWLIAWIERHEKGLDGVIEELKNAEPQSKINPEPPPIRHLRSYSNYLSPRLGLLSADSWTLVGTLCRNLILIWLVMFPLIAAFLIIPRIAAGFVLLGVKISSEAARWSWFGFGTFCLVWAITYMSMHRPSVSRLRTSQGKFLLFCFLPLFLSAACLTTFWAWNNLQSSLDGGSVWSRFEGTMVWTYFHDKHLLAFVAYALLVGMMSLVASLVFLKPRKRKRDQRSPAALVKEMLSLACSGLIGGWLLWFAAERVLNNVSIHPILYTCLAAPVYFLTFLLAATFFIGISSHRTRDEDREWWARAGAWMLIFIGVWLLFSFLVMFGPPNLWYVWSSVIGGVSGLLTILLGRSPKTHSETGKKEEKPANKWVPLLMNVALAFAAPIFVAVLVVLLSAATSWLINWLARDMVGKTLVEAVKFQDLGQQHQDILYCSSYWPVSGVVLGLMVALTLFGILMTWLIDTNKFSLHAMYRNRLIRAYLGASNIARHPNPFTGFDKHDNLQMHRIWPSITPDEPEKRRNKLLYVINMALNLVSGDNLAWQQRKAQSFTVSPLHAGSFQLSHPGPCVPDGTGRCTRDHFGYYRRSGNDPKIEGPKSRTQYYGGRDGISLGTAVTISGAAASPNMGYHSSPAITFLLTLFNARLGWWLGNPGPKGKDTYHLHAPKFAIGPFVEALGFTNANQPDVYLSDGGHFENLGLYEMILRRCHFIVVSDASQDEACKFQDLGGAVRKIRIDLGIPIEFDDQFAIFARSEDRRQNCDGRYCAVGRIRYSCVDGDGVEDGVLIYLKPAFYGLKEPRDVYEYAMANQKFPHETTADQFFTESQFESYRILGSHIMERLSEGDGQIVDFDDFKRRCERHLNGDQAAAASAGD